MKREVTRLLTILSLSASSGRCADFAACLQALTLEFNNAGAFDIQVQLRVEELHLLQPGFFLNSRGAQQREDVLHCIAAGGFGAVIIWLPHLLALRAWTSFTLPLPA